MFYGWCLISHVWLDRLGWSSSKKQTGGEGTFRQQHDKNRKSSPGHLDKRRRETSAWTFVCLLYAAKVEVIETRLKCVQQTQAYSLTDSGLEVEQGLLFPHVLDFFFFLSFLDRCTAIKRSLVVCICEVPLNPNWFHIQTAGIMGVNLIKEILWCTNDLQQQHTLGWIT